MHGKLFIKKFMIDSRRPFERIIRIHDRLQLRQPHVATKGELMNLCQIAERTLKSDIGYMRDILDAPVHYDRKEKGWRYTEKYDISRHLGFTDQVFNRLQLGLEMLSNYEGIRFVDEEQFSKIRHKFQFTADNPYSKYIYFENAPYYQGAKLVGFFLQAIEGHHPVQFEYESFKTPGLRKRILNPYILKERGNRWYVVGTLPEFDGALATYALDRIKQNERLEMLEKTFQRDSGFDVEEIYKYTYGMTVLDAPVEEVVLHFTPLQARYFQSKPFYPYEVIDHSENGLAVKMKVIPNWEFVHKLMSLGDGVEVEKPEKLRVIMKRELQKAILKYE